MTITIAEVSDVLGPARAERDAKLDTLRIEYDAAYKALEEEQLDTQTNINQRRSLLSSAYDAAHSVVYREYQDTVRTVTGNAHVDMYA